MGVYLFIQVKTPPAQAGATQVTSSTPPSPTPREPKVAPTPAAPAADAHVAAPVPGSTRTTWERTPSGDPAASDDPDGRKVDMKVDNLMEVANKAYDAQDFDQATAIAGKVLTKDPTNVRMLRIMVSANCIGGDSAVAQQYYDRLPKFDREQMKARCDRYGVTFKD
jgi:hypothetical protein